MLDTRGIVIRSLKYGETSVIADIFTEEKGLISFIAGGVRTAKSRMAYGLFQPMTIVELTAYYREGPGLNRIREMRAAEPFTKIPFDVRRGAVALFMAEICRKCLHPGEENRALFDFLYAGLKELDTSPHPIANIHLHFLLAFSEHLGFQPQPEEEFEGEPYCFDLFEGRFIPAGAGGADLLPAHETSFLLALLNLPLDECHIVDIPRDARKTLLAALLRFYRLHVPGFGEIHTPEVLETVLG